MKIIPKIFVNSLKKLEIGATRDLSFFFILNEVEFGFEIW